MSRTTFLAIVILVACPGRSADAQDLALQFRDGRVSLQAQDVPLRTLLAEWARVGRTAIINGDRVVDVNMTLELNEVPEGQAVDLLLQSVGGYIAVWRGADRAGAATFDPILILPASGAVALAPASATRPSTSETRQDDSIGGLDGLPGLTGPDDPISAPDEALPILRKRDPARRDD